MYLAMVNSNVELRPVVPRAPRRPGGHRIGAASARSLLLTLLGEFVLPAAEPPWTSALLTGLSLLGVEEKATRQALARMAGEGWVAPSRSGRRACWRLTAAGRELLSTGAERIYGFSSPLAAWDGRWLVVLVSAPDGSRQLRHLLRTRLAWTGLGSLTPGVWVSPHPGRQPEVRRVLEDVGVAGGATFFVASLGELGDAKRVAGQAWNLTEIEARYEEFIGQVRRLAPRTPNETFAAQVRLVQQWRRFPLLDPGLPAELLPDLWTGAEAAALFRSRHAAWKPPADAAWRGFADM
ncbi:MAG TPA: PaaX family transcriptional regulator C-terminal domain-containing protein [Streptosporangiaceae bacterium]|nr:PaaX family transcriptional regulator C-terminal domain-containing protein [Streptosporangiaceae bacterium]